MKQPPRVMSSPYMQWAKKQHGQQIRYNLAVSGMPDIPLSALPVQIDDLEITSDSYYGYPPLQEALAMKAGVPTDRMFQSAGTSLANHIAMAVAFEPGDDVLVEHPTYECLLSTALYLGASVRRFQRRQENGFRTDTDELRGMATKRTRLIAITNLHNPTSIGTDEATLREIGEIARSVGARVLVDEVYLDAAFDQAPTSAAHLGDAFIVTNSLTKVYGLSGLRCGWVVAAPELVQKMWHLNDLFGVNAGHAAERLSVIALKHLNGFHAQTKSVLTRNQTIVQEFLRGREELETVLPGYGTIVFPRLRSGHVEELATLLREKYQTVITPGAFFEMPNHFRIGLSLETESLEGGLRNIGLALDELRCHR